MRKEFTLFIGILFLLVFVKVVLAALNLGFEINLNKPTYYPNETIQMNITVTNRELRYSASNLNLTLFIGKRTYDFDLGNLKAGQSITKSLILPEQPAGSYLVRGVLTYTGYFGETTTLENYNNIEVKFPELKRLPRNIYISNFSLPENIEQGKSYEASVIVTNNDTITGDLSIVVEALGSNSTKEIELDPNKTETSKLNITFVNSGLSTAEARVYGIVDDIKYLLNYLSKTIFVKEMKQAKLLLDKVDLFDESDNEINQNDEVKIKIHIKNIGDSPAYSVKGTLSSNETLSIMKSSVDYKLILNKEISSEGYYEIKLTNTQTGTYNLNLDVSYSDSAGNHLINFIVPLEVKKELCTNDNQCTSNEICSTGTCTKLICGEDSYPQDHKCKKYECVKDSDCKQQYYTCDTKLHVCKPPQCTSDLQCADNEVCSTEGKCKKAFTLIVVPLGISTQDEDKYIKYAKNEIIFFRDASPLRESNISQSKNLRVHYINSSLCKEDTRCSYQSSNYCYEEMARCAKRSGLIGIADKIVGIIDKSIGVCGFAPMGGFYSVNKLGCKGTPAHEIGHNLDLGHINCVANDRWTCIPPNGDDCNEADKSTDIMSYCSDTHYGPQAYRYMKTEYFKVFLEME